MYSCIDNGKCACEWEQSFGISNGVANIWSKDLQVLYQFNLESSFRLHTHTHTLTTALISSPQTFPPKTSISPASRKCAIFLSNFENIPAKYHELFHCFVVVSASRSANKRYSSHFSFWRWKVESSLGPFGIQLKRTREMLRKGSVWETETGTFPV